MVQYLYVDQAQGDQGRCLGNAARLDLCSGRLDHPGDPAFPPSDDPARDPVCEHRSDVYNLVASSWSDVWTRVPAWSARRSGSNERGHPLPQPVAQSDILSLLSLLRPQAYVGGKIRLGAPCDGGYVLPDAALDCDALLSIGIGNDVSFDLALAERGLPVFQYDHTVPAPPVAHERFHFARLGWGPATSDPFVSLHDMMAGLQECGSLRPLLKFDIEGGEYDVLETIDLDALASFPVIVCELHMLSGLADPLFHARMRRCLGVLTRHHVPVHLHANNYEVMALVGGVPVPDVLEVSRLRRDLGVLPHAATDPIPGPLDRPNHPLRPDLCMTPFGA